MRIPSGALEVSPGLWLDPLGAMVIQQTGVALVSDLHLGKSLQFRRSGLAVPEGSDERTLQTLGRLVDRWRIQHLAILGDFVHGPDAVSDDLLAAWIEARQAWSLREISLAEGNHDRSALRRISLDAFGLVPVQDLHFRAEAHGLSSDLIGAHEPIGDSRAEGQCIFVAGHLHPAIRLRGSGRESLTLKCFWREGTQWVLPSFGAFTGGAQLMPRRDSRAYPLSGEGIWGPLLWRSGAWQRGP